LHAASFCDLLAVYDDANLVTDVFCLVDDVCAVHDGRIACELLDLFVEVPAGDGVHAARGFIQKEDRGVGNGRQDLI